MTHLVKRFSLTKINSVTVGTEWPRPRMRNIFLSPKYATGGWIIQCPIVRAPQGGNIGNREDTVSYPVNGQDSNPRSELTFVRASCFTNFATKAFYTWWNNNWIQLIVPESAKCIYSTMVKHKILLYHNGKELRSHTLTWDPTGPGFSWDPIEEVNSRSPV